MSLLLETLKILNGQLINVEYHQERFSRSRRDLFGISNHLKLSESIVVPQQFKKGLIKCRIVYSETILKVEFQPYLFRKVSTLKIVTDNKIDYSYKFEDRHRLNELYDLRGNCDDILIIKNGLATDSYVGNVALYKNNQWVTPDIPLLKGTKRAFLIDEGILSEKKITQQELFDYEKISIINAMVDLGEVVLPINEVTII